MCKEMEIYNVVKKGGTKKLCRTKQQYWNDKLNVMVWYVLSNFLNVSSRVKEGLYEFKYYQSKFDKRFFKRQFERGQALQLEQLQLNNPHQFWRQINKLGPQKSKAIPMEILKENGESCF